MDKDVDFNQDGSLTWEDFLHFANSGAFGTMEGDANYDPKYDLNGDNRVDIADADLLMKRIPRPGNDGE